MKNNNEDIKMRWRVHFEPIDIEGKDMDDAIRKLDEGVYGSPDIRKIFPIDKDGFPVDMKV